MVTALPPAPRLGRVRTVCDRSMGLPRRKHMDLERRHSVAMAGSCPVARRGLLLNGDVSNLGLKSTAHSAFTSLIGNAYPSLVARPMRRRGSLRPRRWHRGAEFLGTRMARHPGAARIARRPRRDSRHVGKPWVRRRSVVPGAPERLQVDRGAGDTSG